MVLLTHYRAPHSGPGSAQEHTYLASQKGPTTSYLRSTHCLPLTPLLNARFCPDTGRSVVSMTLRNLLFAAVRQAKGDRKSEGTTAMGAGGSERQNGGTAGSQGRPVWGVSELWLSGSMLLLCPSRRLTATFSPHIFHPLKPAVCIKPWDCLGQVS